MYWQILPHFSVNMISLDIKRTSCYVDDVHQPHPQDHGYISVHDQLCINVALLKKKKQTTWVGAPLDQLASSRRLHLPDRDVQPTLAMFMTEFISMPEIKRLHSMVATQLLQFPPKARFKLRALG